MKITTLMTILCLILSLFLFARIDMWASEKKDDSNETVYKAEKNYDGKKKEYKTIEAVQKEIRVTLSLEGYFEDVDAVPFESSFFSEAHMSIRANKNRLSIRHKIVIGVVIFITFNFFV